MSSRWKASLLHLCVIASAAVATAAFLGAMRIVAVDAWQRGRFLPKDRPPPETEAVVALAMEYVIGCAEYNDVIALGDSICFCGFAPLVFEGSTGSRAYNLGLALTLGWEPRRIILQRYLQNHPQPRLILVAISPVKFTFGQEMARMEAAATEQVKACYGEHHPSTWQRAARMGVEELRELVTGPNPDVLSAPLVEPVFARGRESYHALRKLLRSHRGHRPVFNALSTKPVRFEAFALTDAMHREAAEFLRAADGIPVAIVFTPTAGPVDNIDSLVAGFKQLGFDTSGARALDYPSGLFNDFVLHLNREGAQRFTRLIADSFCGDQGAEGRQKSEPPRPTAPQRRTQIQQSGPFPVDGDGGSGESGSRGRGPGKVVSRTEK
jgi:hypothetical protein